MHDPAAVGWCSNVLSAGSVGTLLEQLPPVLDAVGEGVPIGLWLPSTMLDEDLIPLTSVLRSRRTPVLGLNAFPMRDFHDDIVKDRVYRPHWADPARLDYTVGAAHALAGLLEPGTRAGLTTVPLGWPSHDVDLVAAARALTTACDQIADIASTHGIHLHLAIEPEPGCLLDTAAAVASFVEDQDLRDLARRGLLGVCLDACHLAVMHESPRQAVEALSAVDLDVTRVQLSSAPEAQGAEALAALSALDEPRWMHQTTVFTDDLAYWDDLPHAIEHAPPEGVWRTHLHVPVHLERIGPLHTTQRTIVELLEAVADLDRRPMLEVETYAWSVLPDAARRATLADDIAEELSWVHAVLEEIDW